MNRLRHLRAQQRSPIPERLGSEGFVQQRNLGHAHQHKRNRRPHATPQRPAHRRGRYRLPCPRRLVAAAAGLCLSQGVAAIPLLSEIHYNGPAPGADPDEFIELSNALNQELDLGGYRFAAGIDFEFAAGLRMRALSSLVIARDPAGFSASFPDYSGPLFDFAGALSNSGETLSLVDRSGQLQWSIRYDDSGLWPREADGQGFSLQRLDADASAGQAENWFAATPNPGVWNALADANEGSTAAQPVGAPAPLTLLLASALLLHSRRPGDRGNGEY